MDGSVSSGEELSISHTWETEGTYTIKVKAKDEYGAESGWATLSVSMPRNRAINTPFMQFLQNFLQNHPLIYQLLQKFLKL